MLKNRDLINSSEICFKLICTHPGVGCSEIKGKTRSAGDVGLGMNSLNKGFYIAIGDVKARLSPSSRQPNALRAITPAAVEVLLGVLQRGGGETPLVPGLLKLALRGVVAVVHVLHGSSPGVGPVPLRVLLDGYFRVLNSDLPVASLAPEAAGGLITLRVLMLGRWLGTGVGTGTRDGC